MVRTSCSLSSRHTAVAFNNAKAARFLRHQHAPIGQEGKRPRVGQSLHHHDGFQGLRRSGARVKQGCGNDER